MQFVLRCNCPKVRDSPPPNDCVQAMDALKSCGTSKCSLPPQNNQGQSTNKSEALPFMRLPRRKWLQMSAEWTSLFHITIYLL